LLINIYGLCLKCAFIIPDIYRVQHESHRIVVKLIEKYLDGSPWKGEQSFGPLTVMRRGTISKTNTRRKRVQLNPGHRYSHPRKCINKSIWLAPGRYPWCTHGRCPPQLPTKLICLCIFWVRVAVA
jgi:hypothetical protein